MKMISQGKLSFVVCLLTIPLTISEFRVLNKTLRNKKSVIIEKDDYLIQTPGCTIPNIWKDRQIFDGKDCKNSCGKRAVYVRKLKYDNVIKYIIDGYRMKEYFGENIYECCSQFAYRLPSDTLEYTQCKSFTNGTKHLLMYELIVITCQSKDNLTNVVYEDVYMMPKKVERGVRNDGNSWNVVMLGMDTISRARAIKSMPALLKYFEDSGWLDFKAFQKAESNTFPNIMILLTGKLPYKTFIEVCHSDIISCNDFFIWSKYKRSGYITAYGEDSLPDSFIREFKESPTDHYTRPFYLMNIQEKGNIACMKTRPAAYHLLDYAYKFVKSYIDEKFFGYFFTSTYSHDPNRLPKLLQNRLINFFQKLNKTGALNNTIVIFFGDHGIRYGDLKLPVESFYDERLPMLFMWIPPSFRHRFVTEFENLQLNQHRLITHSDLHSTLWHFLKLSDENVTIIPPDYCPDCGSLLEEKSSNRSCEDMRVSQRWCSCHKLKVISSSDIEATLVPEILLYNLCKEQNLDLQIKRILRHHWFRHLDVIYHVLAVELQNGKQYESIIRQDYFDFVVVGEIDNISPRDMVYDNSQC